MFGLVCAVVVGSQDLERAEAAEKSEDAEEAEAAAPLAFDEMVAFLKQAGLTTHKLPEQLEIVDRLPRNPTGKVIKRDLVARFRD